MTKTLCLLALLLCLVAIESAAMVNGFINQAQAEVQPLEPGKTVERKAVGGESHTFRIKLTTGEYVRIAAEQRGIDISLTLTAPDGQQVVALNLIRPGGIESLSAAAKSDGEYRLAVRVAGSASSGGAYLLRAETRAPNPEDLKRIAAQALVLRAKQLIRQGPGSASHVIEASDQALAIWRELNDQQMIASSLIEIGGAHFLLARHDKASEFARQAVSVARAAGDRGGEEYALFLIANITSSLNQYEQAIQNAEQALHIAREIKDRYYESFFLSQIGFTNYTLGRYQKAAEYYEQALRMAREDRDRRSEGVSLVRLGMVYMGLSQSEKAIEVIDPAVEIFRTLKDRQSEGMALSNLGAAHSYLSHYDKAIEILDQTVAIARETKNPGLEGNALLNLAGIQASMGRYETALELSESALKRAREIKDRILEARLLLQRSNLFALVNRNDQSIDYAEQALKINRETKYLNGQGDTLSTLGSAYARQNQYDKAIEYYEQSLSVRRELKDQEGVSVSLSNMAQTYVSLGQAEKAIKYYEEALQIGRDIKLPTRQAAALAGLGETYRKLGKFDRAAELLAQALTINREIRRRPNEATTLYYLALTERARGNLASARSKVEESLSITESIRTELLSPDARSSLLADVQDAYRLHIDLLMRQNGAVPSPQDAALAFQVSERQRARSLLDLLAEARANVRRGVDPSVLERERELARQLNARAGEQVQLLSRQHTPEQAAALKREINQLENDYERTQAQIRRASPGYAALTQPQPLALKEIQEQLDPDTLLLEYSLGSERSYLWAVTRDAISSFELLPEKQIKQAAVDLYSLMTARSRFEKGETAQQKQQRVREAESRLTNAARALSSMVLEPVANELTKKRLVVVADGALQYIPFAMLPAPEKGRRGEGEKGRQGEGARGRQGEGATGRQGKAAVAASPSRPLAQSPSRRVTPSPSRPLALTPLIVNHEIVSLPSASTLAVQRKEFTGRKAAPRMIAVIADPVFSPSDTRLRLDPSLQTNAIAQAKAAGDDGARIIEHLSGDSISGGPGTLRIPRLPFTSLEADRIMAVAPGAANFQAVGLKANRTTVTSGALKDYRYLHFATHGYLDSERPGLSSLVLSMVDEQGKPQDGFLRANDIYNLELPAELVVLSACQTGLGKEIKGEGLVGLTRGFMYAGAARVVVSLWSVNDKATADLMTRFYEKMLKHGERPAAALRAAQVEMWKQKQWQSPYYWAAFTLQGEWR